MREQAQNPVSPDNNTSDYRTWGDTTNIKPEATFNFDFIQLAARLVAAGFSEKDLAYALGVKKGSITKWKSLYPQFKKACLDGKNMAKRFLVAHGLRAAGGYDYETTKEKKFLDANGELLKTEVLTETHHKPPNHQLLMFMLCNIDRQLNDNEFKSRHSIETDHKRTVVQIGKPEAEKICEFAGGLIDSEEEKDEE